MHAKISINWLESLTQITESVIDYNAGVIDLLLEYVERKGSHDAERMSSGAATVPPRQECEWDPSHPIPSQDPWVVWITSFFTLRKAAD